MSYVRVNIFDENTAISGDLHSSMTEPLVAALTAEPVTIDEFETALHRFIEKDSDWSIFRQFAPHENLEPYDAGIVAIDLAARVCAIDSTYDPPSKEGGVRVPKLFSDEDEDPVIPYRVPDDWIFLYSVDTFEGTAAHHRKERAKNPPIDVREILFGDQLLEFLVVELKNTQAYEREDTIPDIHARWLMTPLSELRGKTPREVMFEKHDFVNVELNSRMAQWSFTKVCPPPIEVGSYAYRYAGFGTHEIVLYYDTIRDLMHEACEKLKADPGVSIDDLIAYLVEAKDEVLTSPDFEFRGRTRSELIDLERRRITITATADEVCIDEECPTCVAMSEDFDTPMFWFLDGSNMDHRFEFSFSRTREEWDEEQSRWEEFNREFDRKWKQRADGTESLDAEQPF